MLSCPCKNLLPFHMLRFPLWLCSTNLRLIMLILLDVSSVLASNPKWIRVPYMHFTLLYFTTFYANRVKKPSFFFFYLSFLNIFPLPGIRKKTSFIFKRKSMSRLKISVLGQSFFLIEFRNAWIQINLNALMVLKVRPSLSLF